MRANETKLYQINVTVNDMPHCLMVGADELLVNVLRNKLGFTSVKRGCDSGECGACTIILDGKAVSSCLVLAVEANGKKIITVEGLTSDGSLHPLQQAFMENGAIQCGFCTPGMLLTAKALLDENPHPTTNEIKEALEHNLCRCTGYVKIIEAIESVSGKKS